jgi:hypothetical protein
VNFISLAHVAKAQKISTLLQMAYSAEKAAALHIKAMPISKK